jgi:GTP-binding protein HflX
MKRDSRERAYLIAACPKSESKTRCFEEELNELEQLASTVDVIVVGRYMQMLEKPNNRTYVGSGKLKEIKQHLKEDEVDTLIFNDNLTPSQARNIAQTTNCNIVDRTELILDIFAQHARTNASRLQVELAQMEYNYSKLRNLWQHLSRIEGGIGMRGPGEKQIETDRRVVKKRITILKRRLAEIQQNEMTKRKKREDLFTAAIVGYTNAGKSTLFNRLTHAEVLVADQLFATLDATTRRLRFSDASEIILTDTIGFIKNLPHTLVSSFYATLLEVMEADVLLHVVDISNPMMRENISAVESVLKEIKADHISQIHVFNKWDKMEGVESKFLRKPLQMQYPEAIFTSAITGENLPELLSTLHALRERKARETAIRIPEEMDKLLAFVMKNADVLDAELDEENGEYVLFLLASPELMTNIKEQVDNFREKQFINSRSPKD